MRLKIVFRDGKAEVDVEGAVGKKCIEVTDDILSILNAEIEKRKLKPEYYRVSQTTREYEVSP